MVPEVKKILTEVEDDVAKNITLKIQTNGTIEPDKKWIEIFKKFKRTKVNLSIDAFGNDNHYVRFPSDWNKITATIKVLETHVSGAGVEYTAAGRHTIPNLRCQDPFHLPDGS